MLILITYDVNITTKEGVTRLRKISKICKNYGQRVQNSVFECSVNPTQLVILKNQLEVCIDKENDDLRIYYLGKNWERKIEILGKNKTYNPDTGFLII